MALKNVVGLDHVVVVVRDLDGAAGIWRRLGFTVSPRGTHSAHMGTGNYTIMLGEDYIELLGVLTPTDRNLPTRKYLERRQGIERAAFTAVSAAGLADELKAKGFNPVIGPLDFSRPVDRADGSKTEASFRTTQWPVVERPGDLRLFACEHLTREAVWLPELVTHANAAARIDYIELLARDPKASAEHMARLIDQPAGMEADGSYRIRSGGNRADFIFLDRKTLEMRHPGVDLGDVGDECAITLSLQVSDDAATAKALAGIPTVVAPGAIQVPPAHANGVLLQFTIA